jgi:hypothetical protein
MPKKLSAKSVPPTATLYGVLAKPLTLIPLTAAGAKMSDTSAPPSPAATNTLTPS